MFSELAKVGDLDAQTLCAGMVEEIDPSIRYCNYQLSKAGGAAPDPAQLLSLGAGQEQSRGLDILQVRNIICTDGGSFEHECFCKAV